MARRVVSGDEFEEQIHALEVPDPLLRRGAVVKQVPKGPERRKQDLKGRKKEEEEKEKERC